MVRSSLRLARAIAPWLISTVLSFPLLLIARGAIAASAMPNSVTVDGFDVSYPDGWSTLQAGRITIIVGVASDKLATLTSDQLLVEPQVRISSEQRVDHNDALNRLSEVAGETSVASTHLTVGGWPAIQRRGLAPWPIPGSSAAANGHALTIVTVIAAGRQLIRLDGSLPSDAPSATADAVAAIETSVTFRAGSSSNVMTRHLDRLARKLGITPIREDVSALVRAGKALALRAIAGDLAQADDDDEEGDENIPVGSPAESASSPGTPGSAQRLIIGSAQAEPEVAATDDGRNIVVCQQKDYSSSNDGGQTFPNFAVFSNSTGGDCSLAVGKSQNFYEATIANSSTAINISTDSGKTFSFQANAFTCGSGQCGFNGASIPDQEHIGADRVNATASGDQVYSVFRDGFVPPLWGIVCSTDSGSTWSSGNVGLSGDFPRVVVGQDGNVWVAFVNGSNLMLDKFAACSGNSGMSESSGFPKTVVSGVPDIPCPVPGLDRCNNGNTLRSPMVAVDDTNASHLYFSYAVNTGSGNENIMIVDSGDGGSTWSSPVKLNGGGSARRFMPWVCATKGTAYVTWYDRRNATASNNDLTDYMGASAFLTGSTLTAGSEFQVNDSSTSDAQCLGGQTVGSQKSWPGGSRATGDSTSCSEQPELAGVCGTGACGTGGTCPSGQTCDTTGICRNGPQQFCDFVSTTCSNSGDSCQLWGGGVPKYGDYNGNACVVGHLLTTWASATPPRTTNPGIDLFFTLRDFVQPIASCKNVTVPTDPNVCTASGVSIDNGSTDPDNDTFTLSQSPPNPYPKGTTSVTLTITDQNDETNSCTANVLVQDEQPPNISCPTPTAECTSPSGASVALNPTVSDNCPGVGSPSCTPPSGSVFPIGMTPFSCQVSDSSGNMNSCNSKVNVVDTTPPVINSVVATPNTLWPPNHKLVPVSVVVTATDICDLSPTCQITSVSSSEPVTGPGSGNTSPDWIVTTPGPAVSPASLGVELRAERDGGGSGRVYTIGVQCSDASHNTSNATTTVTVAHDQGS